MMKPNTLRLMQLYVAFFVLSLFQVVLAEEVRLVKDGGVYHLPVKINDAIELKFVVDTGAADVLIPADVVLTLMRTGTISKSDFLGKGSYQMADGSLAEHANFNLRSLQIGSHLIRNVHASIGPVEGSLLLGQSALEQLEPWRMETKRGVFVFGEDAGTSSRKPRQEQPVDSIKPLEGGVIYFAADKAPTEHAPPEAHLCYKFQVASPEEQLNKLKKKYPELYDYKITKNGDGSKNLVAKRRDEAGAGGEINYFYSTNPGLCNEYQAKKLNASRSQISSNVSSTADGYGWIQLTTDDKGNTFYVASQRMERDGSLAKIWQKETLKAVIQRGVESIVTCNLIDCANKKIMILGGEVYDKNNKAVDKFDGKNEWQWLKPETIGWSMYEYACGN